MAYPSLRCCIVEANTVIELTNASSPKAKAKQRSQKPQSIASQQASSLLSSAPSPRDAWIAFEKLQDQLDDVLLVGLKQLGYNSRDCQVAINAWKYDSKKKY